MLIPRFSLRTLLGAMTVFAVLALVVSMAVRGQSWAIGVAAGAASLVLALVVNAALFVAAASATAIVDVFRPRDAGQSPFADSRLPSRHATPEDP